MMENIVILKEKNLEYIKETFKGDLMLFNHYPIKSLDNLKDKENVKYIIHSTEEDIYIVILKYTYAELIEKMFENKTENTEEKDNGEHK